MTSEISGHASAHTMLLEIADAAGIERGAAFTADEIVRRLMALGAETAAQRAEEEGRRK